MTGTSYASDVLSLSGIRVEACKNGMVVDRVETAFGRDFKPKNIILVGPQFETFSLVITLTAEGQVIA